MPNLRAVWYLPFSFDYLLSLLLRQGELATEAVRPDAEATRRATDDLVRVMAENPKFRDSEFFDFMSKVNSGELEFKDNTVVETGLKVGGRAGGRRVGRGRAATKHRRDARAKESSVH
jgi:hypothetical protein